MPVERPVLLTDKLEGIPSKVIILVASNFPSRVTTLTYATDPRKDFLQVTVAVSAPSDAGVTVM